MNFFYYRSLAVALTMACLTGLNLSCGPSDLPEETQTPTEKSLTWESVEVIRRDFIPHIQARGLIKPSVGSEVRVGSRVSGIVQKLNLKIGDTVTKGQLLAELEPTELTARLNQAEATLNNARAQLDYARLDVERKRTLFKENLVSQNELDRSERSHDVAKSQIEQAQANLDFARIQLSYTKIHAPIAGIVASVSTQEGETVAASFSAPTFVTIIDLERLEVWAYVDEADIGRIILGQKAVFSVETYPDTDFNAEVTAINPKAEIQNDAAKYVTVLRITREKGKYLRPEMRTSVTIPLEPRQDVLVAPHAAIHRENGTYFVYLDSGDTPIKQAVKVGARNNQFAEILHGLDQGNRVVIGDIHN